MRARAWISAVVVVCLAAAVLAVATRTRATRAAAEALPDGAIGTVEGSLTPPMTEPAREPAPAEFAPRGDVTGMPPREGRANVPTSELLAELEAARALGFVSDARLANFLASAYLDAGQFQRALQVMQIHGSRDATLWARLTSVFAKAGDVAGQRDALLAALRVQPRNPGLFADLGRLEPDLALAEVSRLLAADPPPGDVDLRQVMAELLTRSGRGAEARIVIDGLLAQNPVHPENVWLLFELQPAQAITHVEQQMASSPRPAELREMLVRFLTKSGSAEQAEALLERFEREGQSVGSDEWGTIAGFWLDAEDTARGVAALQQALEHERSDPDQWVHPLTELAPAQLLLALERRVASDAARNDEYWGALADVYWAAGRPADARVAWERAAWLDPGDDEWPGRLQALDRGRDPHE